MVSEWIDRVVARTAARVSAFTDRLAKVLAPVMPWLFVALRRAWVPTVIAVAAAVMFFAVPQSREVLRGLSEPALGSLADFNDKAQHRAINGLSWASYVLAAVLMSAAVWYSARLLVTVGAQRGTPNALEQPAAAYAGLIRATTWYPRWLGAGVLAASVGALVFANYTPGLPDWPALALSLLAVTGPWMVGVGWWLRRNTPRERAARLWMSTGAVVTAGAVAWMVGEAEKRPVWIWSVACSTLPAIMWIVLAERRSELQRRGRVDLSLPAASRGFGSVIIVSILLALTAGGVLLLLAFLPPLPIRAFGSAAAVLVFLAATCAFASAGQLWLRYAASDVPGLTTATTAVITLLIAIFGQEGLGEETLPPPPITAAAMAAAMAPPDVVTPTLYVNAFGGGLRAGVFTAMVLAQADDASCGRFGRHLKAASGVSGGSLGLATYLVARQELVATGIWKDCGATDVEVSAPLTEVVVHALVQDHLSPVISRMLAVDAPHLHGLFAQPPTRGQALLDSWNGALRTALETSLDVQAPKDLAAFALPLAKLHGGMTPAPSVYFNASDADSGHIVWFTNVQGAQVATLGHSPTPTDISVGQAVLHSARFPLVTPAGAFRAPWAPDAKLSRRLVDGGYADNSGATTLLDVARSDGWITVNIDGNPSPVPSCAKAPRTHPPIVTAVRGLLQARSAHADQALDRLKGSAAADRRLDLRLDLAALYQKPSGPSCERIATAQQPPLGWYMSYEAAMLLLHASRPAAESLCKTLDLACRRLPELPPLR